MNRRSMLQGACCATLLQSTLLSAEAKPSRQNTSIAPLPPGYAVVGQRMGVPPMVLYGVALQESKLKFGEHALPYPWTLCVRGVAQRYDSYDAAVSALTGYVGRGITNVDCGSMQVNWHWNKERLRTFRRALDPYPNLFIGAQILVEHFNTTGSWFKAVGRYHHQVDRVRADNYATAVFARFSKIPRGSVAHA
jgi:soluble lytic murein transglycosylase-like protein